MWASWLTARVSSGWGRGTGHSQVGDDRAGAALQRHEQGERIALLLPRGAEDARHDLLRGGTPRRAVATTHLAGHDGRANRLFGLPVRRFDPGVPQTGEEREPLGAQVLKEAAVWRMHHMAGEEAIGARLEAAEGHGEPVPGERARVPAIAKCERPQQHAAHSVREAGRPALGGLEQQARAAQEMRKTGLVGGVRELAVGRPAVAHEHAGVARTEDGADLRVAAAGLDRVDRSGATTALSRTAVMRAA